MPEDSNILVLAMDVFGDSKYDIHESVQELIYKMNKFLGHTYQALTSKFTVTEKTKKALTIVKHIIIGILLSPVVYLICVQMLHMSKFFLFYTTAYIAFNILLMLTKKCLTLINGILAD
jgi:hypothetical protein